MENELTEDTLLTAEAWLNEGREIAIATVIQTWGSSPRPGGSRLVVDNNSNFQGSVSGGCVEGAVIAEALAQGEALVAYGFSTGQQYHLFLAVGNSHKHFPQEL